jgi:hypothetical protein
MELPRTRSVCSEFVATRQHEQCADPFFPPFSDGKDVTGHIFEYTTQVVVDANGTVSGGIAPVQVLFCLKEQSEPSTSLDRAGTRTVC